MMMSLNQLETQALGSIADGLAGSGGCRMT
jgi:hypothetical protein